MISATSLQNGGPMITKLSMLLGRRPSSGKCFQVRTSERRPGMTLGGNVVDVSSRGGDTLMSYGGWGKKEVGVRRHDRTCESTSASCQTCVQ